MPKINPCLWFDGQAEEAARFYTSIFKNSKITAISRWPEGAPGPAGDVLTVEFELDGQTFTGLNGGPHFKFNEAVSFQVPCADQAEVDYFWDRLLDGGEPSRCGWLKDRFGVSWQVFPRALPELLSGSDEAKAQRAMAAMMTMAKIDLAAIERAANG